MPLKIETQLDQIKGMMEMEEKITEINIDLEKGDFYAMIEIEDYLPLQKKYLSTYGAGHQAMINMALANLFN